MDRTPADLEAALEATRDPAERIDIMLDLSDIYLRSDPGRAFEIASSALRISRGRRDRVRTMRATVTLGFCEYYLGEHSAARQRFESAMERISASGDQMMLSRALHGLGIALTGTGEHVRAMEALNRARLLAEDIGNDTMLLGFIFNSIGSLESSLGDSAAALASYARSRSLFESTGCRTGLIYTINNVGTVQLSLNEPALALEQFTEVLELARAEGDYRSEVAGLCNVATALQQLGRVDQARDGYLRALDIARAMADDANLAYALCGIGILHKEKKELELALDGITEAYTIAERAEDPGRWRYLALIGEVELELERLQTARVTLETALAGAEQAGDRDLMYQIHELLSARHEASGDISKAFEHHKQYVALREEVMGQEQQRVLARYRMRAEIERSEREREILRLETNRLQREMEHKSKELATLALTLVEKSQFLDSLKREMTEVAHTVEGTARPAMKGLLRQVDGNASAKSDWKLFENQFERTHQDFLKRLLAACGALTRTELKVCALLKINLSSKEIGDLLRTSPRTIERHRTTIRKKLGLGAGVDLAAHFTAL